MMLQPSARDATKRLYVIAADTYVTKITCCESAGYLAVEKVEILIGGERGKPDLILPKYVRNDITLSM